MTWTIPETKTLQELLRLPYIDESPAWEYINGEAIQKPMGGANTAYYKNVSTAA